MVARSESTEGLSVSSTFANNLPGDVLSSGEAVSVFVTIVPDRYISVSHRLIEASDVSCAYVLSSDRVDWWHDYTAGYPVVAVVKE